MSTIESTPLNAIPGAEAVLNSSAGLAGAAGELTTTLSSMPEAPARRMGYGLPCAKCKTYYAAWLTVCPVCKSSERVSVTAVSVPIVASVTVESTPDPKTIEEERERFLREFKSQVYPGGLQVQASETFSCSREENHEGSFEPASVCQSCYDRLRVRVDLAEAALLIDPKEAAQVIYEAVWADPSNPGKTYQNAAQALLSELRRRAGIPSFLGTFQTQAD